ncbi:MAG: hypothetical protein WCK65_06940 [Rhodospirillaceae bacterium]
MACFADPGKRIRTAKTCILQEPRFVLSRDCDEEPHYHGVHFHSEPEHRAMICCYPPCHDIEQERRNLFA